jgi:hypothetical protein
VPISDVADATPGMMKMGSTTFGVALGGVYCVTGRLNSGGSGWSVVDEAGIHFSRPHGQLPLPVPSHDGSIDCTWTATEMHAEFSRNVAKNVATSARWPKTPSALGSELSRLAPLLRGHGINFSFRRTIDHDRDRIAERGRVVSVKTGKFDDIRVSGTNDGE